MGARLLSLLAVLVIVAGCTPKHATDTGQNGGEAVIGQSGPNGTLGGAGPTPGSEQDLVVNVGDRVFFGYDQYDLTAQAKTTIEHQAQWLKTYPNVNVMVEGHCDERGTREYNLALGEKRAMAVRNYLTANGVPANRIQTISYGKERPAVLGSDETAWAQNRRGVVVVQ